MDMYQKREPLIERRLKDPVDSELWSKLTLAQKFSASSLAKYGYELAFIRCSAAGNVAVMQREGNTTIISCEGDINTSSDILIR
jgi:hypothetical protein